MPPHRTCAATAPACAFLSGHILPPDPRTNSRGRGRAVATAAAPQGGTPFCRPHSSPIVALHSHQPFTDQLYALITAEGKVGDSVETVAGVGSPVILLGHQALDQLPPLVVRLQEEDHGAVRLTATGGQRELPQPHHIAGGGEDGGERRGEVGSGLSGGCVGALWTEARDTARALSQTTAAAEDKEEEGGWREGRVRGGAGGRRHDRGEGLRWKGKGRRGRRPAGQGMERQWEGGRDREERRPVATSGLGSGTVWRRRQYRSDTR